MLGREREREVLDRLLDGVRGGRGGVLVVDGEAGVGKTALLEYAVEAARGFRIARTSGIEAEMELPFAAVQQLCSPFLDLLDRLPQPQHEALGVAFGLIAGPAPNPFLVGLAVLGLLAEAAEEQPLVCVVDDAQWLDSASARTLAFVARRLAGGEDRARVRAREPGDRSLDCRSFASYPSGIAMHGRCWSPPCRLGWMSTCWSGSLPRRAGTRSLCWSCRAGLSPTQLAGGFGLPAAVPLSASIEESYHAAAGQSSR